MPRLNRRALAGFLVAVAAARAQAQTQAQTVLTWEQLRERFQIQNPSLAAAGILIDESKASETTAYLRPNPDFTLTADGLQISRNFGVWRPLSGIVETSAFSYLHEREQKRELRLAGAKKATTMSETSQTDLRRNLLFTLRSAYVQVLQAKAVVDNAKENLAYWDRELELSRSRLAAGDMAEVDLSRLELQRVQYESDLETSGVNLRTARIQLLHLLNDRTPVEKFDVTGPYDFSAEVMPLAELRDLALAGRPDLKLAMQGIDAAKLSHQLAVANGSADPTFSLWYSHNPSFTNAFANETMGGSVSIPLRIFDRNQGEKARTQLDIGRNQRLRDAAEAQVFSDVDSAYVTLLGTINLLRPYRANYLPRAEKIRDTVAFSFQNGAASLLDFLDAQKAYRDLRLNYLNLLGSYLTAAGQLNLAVGREVIP